MALMTTITKLIHDNYDMANLINNKSCNHKWHKWLQM